MAKKINVKLILEPRGNRMGRNAIARTRHISINSVGDAFHIADENGISYKDVRNMDEYSVYRIFYPDKFVQESMYAHGGIIDFITGVFSGNWEKTWNRIVRIFKEVFNLIPSIAEGILNGAIRGINGLINGINNIGENFGIWIPAIPDISLPRFATGGFP